MEQTAVFFGVIAAVFIAIAGVVSIVLLIFLDKDGPVKQKIRNKEDDKASLLAVIGSGMN